MPFSSKQGKKQTVEWIQEAGDIKTIFDVGAGAGTYPKLLKETHKILTDANWIGIEAWTDYIKEYDLESKYNTLYNEDIRTFNWSKVPNIDLTIFGDILEHMTKEEAQSLVNTALDHSKYISISIPVKHMPQGASYGNPFEIHVKDNWTHDEVLESFPYIKKSHKLKSIGVYWLSKT